MSDERERDLKKFKFIESFLSRIIEGRLSLFFKKQLFMPNNYYLHYFSVFCLANKINHFLVISNTVASFAVNNFLVPYQKSSPNYNKHI